MEFMCEIILKNLHQHHYGKDGSGTMAVSYGVLILTTSQLHFYTNKK